MRVNLLCLALTARPGRSLPDVLRDTVMQPIGASDTWSWHGYTDAELHGIPVVAGGAHWGGGLFISASDLAHLGELTRRRGQYEKRQLLSRAWAERQWTPCVIRPDDGCLWWLNRDHTVFPNAPSTEICARGNGGRHRLRIDPARELVIASHWGDEIALLLVQISLATNPAA